MKKNITNTLKGAIALCLMISYFYSCSPEESDQQSYPSVELLPSSSTGVTFNNTLNDDPKGERNILAYGHYYNGAGTGLGDFDNDGLVDIFFAGNEVPNQIYKNLGDLRFENRTETAGINKNKIWSAGVSIVDINNDGLLDISVTQCGPYKLSEEKQNLFYINKGDFKFEEQATEMGLNDGKYGTQTAFFDFDKDGDLDIYLMNESKYVQYPIAFVLEEMKDPKKLKEASGVLFRNNGDNTFTDITEEANLIDQSFGLGLLVTDFNNDNYPDIYVANDYSVPDRMYINQKDGTFKDEINLFTNQISYYSMGCDAADINNDGHLDLAVVDMATADHFRGKTLMASMSSDNFNYFTKILDYQFQYMFNVMQLNNGNGSFSNIAGFSGLQKTEWSWAALFVDLDLDSYKDYFVSNGYKRYPRDNDFRIMLKKTRDANGGDVPFDMREEIYAKMPTVPTRNIIFMNDKKLRFKDNPSAFAYPDLPGFSYGTAYGDLDNDGDLELVVNNVDEPAHILKNYSIENKKGNFLTIKLENSDLPSLIYNAKVRISYEDQIQTTEYAFTRGYLSSMDQRVFFGLGKYSKVDKVEILWPDDNLQTILNPTINQELTIRYKKEKKGQWNSKKEPLTDLAEINPESLGLNYKHQENNFEDFDKEILLPQRQSTLGPAIAAGDLNGDGLDDLYVGGAAGQRGQFYIQDQGGNFAETDNTYFEIDENKEDLDAIFLNPNNDNIQELFVASGGGGDMEGQTANLEDRLYAFSQNRYNRVKNAFPQLTSNSYRIKSMDLDGDGNEELLICGAAKPGKYPLSEKSALFSFKNGTFVDVTSEIIPELANIPLIRDVAFTDVNKDNKQDILVVSEWGTPTLFVSGTDGKYTNRSGEYISEEKFGWWASITATDIDNDGDDDFILGNMGRNLKHKVSDKKPLLLYANDFDKNGTLDVVLAKEYKGKVVPARGRECSSEQMPFIENKFKSYESFANADIIDILGEKSVEESTKYKATDFGSYILRNKDGAFFFEELPSKVQIAPVSAGVAVDLNKDGFKDLILAGNYYDTEYETPRQDAGRGIVLMNNQGKDFSALSPTQSGINLNGNYRKLVLVKRKNDQLLVAAENNGPLKVYKLDK